MQHPLVYTAPNGSGRWSRKNSSGGFAGRAITLARTSTNREACLSPYYYHRFFARTFGETPHDFLTRLRIDRAKRLLAREQLPVTQVCFAAGYESLGTFSSRFRHAAERGL